MRFAVPGIVAASGSTVFFNEQNADWTTTVLPEGWVVNDGDNILSATGLYNDSLLAFSQLQITNNPSTVIDSQTVIASFLTGSLTDQFGRFAVGDLGVIVTIDAGVAVCTWAYDIDGGTITGSVSAAEEFAVAVTIDDLGNIEFYFIDAGGTTPGSDTTTPLSPVSGGSAFVQMYASADSGSTFGTPGDLRLTNTFFKVNDVLSQVAIETIVGGWGI